jgi:hypothetical protein
MERERSCAAIFGVSTKPDRRCDAPMPPVEDEGAVHPTGPALIGDGDFTALIAKRASKLLWIARSLSVRRPNRIVLTRPLVADLLSHSLQVEELLDTYGARNNRQWCRFRSLVATTKLFADVAYELLHIHHALPSYQLLPIGRDFAAATAQSLELTHGVLVTAANWLLAQANRLSLPIPTDERRAENYLEHLPPGRLPHDRSARKIKSSNETVTYLASAYLNLAAESELLNIVEKVEPKDYATCFPNPISEDNLRYLKVRFHCLQSLYDTHVSETEIEYLDEDLPTLRGHISIVFHLLEIATYLVHYYERHLNVHTGDSTLRRKPVIAPKTLLAMLMNYSIAFRGALSDLWPLFLLHHAQALRRNRQDRSARALISRLSRPPGHSDRPNRAALRQRYRMELDGQAYDAGSPMDIFRANEKINAQKRRWLVSEIGRLPLPKGN